MTKYPVQPLDLMQWINTKYHEPWIHERIELEGTLDADRLADSLDTLIRVFPLLKCGYDREQNAFLKVENLTGQALVRTAGSVGRTRLLTESLDMRERLIQFTLSEGTLYVTVSHLVCDGGGFKQLLYLFCDIYNGTFSGNPGHWMERDFSQLTKDLPGRAGMTLAMLLSMAGNYKNKPVYAKDSGESAYLVEKTVSREIMDQVNAGAKQRGATLNDVFLTAYARALARLYGQRKVNIPCTVDLRKYAKGETGIANLTGAYNLNVKVKESEPFCETLSAVNARMRGQKKTRNDIAGPMLLVSKYETSSLEAFLKLYGGMDTSAYTDYTNLGVWDEKKLWFQGAAVKNAVGYGVLSKAPCFQIAVSTFRGETTLSSLFQCSGREREKAVRLMDALVSEIHLCANDIFLR